MANTDEGQQQQELKRIEQDKLENALQHLQRSNAELEQEMQSDADPELHAAVKASACSRLSCFIAAWMVAESLLQLLHQSRHQPQESWQLCERAFSRSLPAL